MGKMLCGEVAIEAPARRNRGKRSDNEASCASRCVRDGQAAPVPFTAAPRDDVQVEHSRTPAAAGAAAKFAFDCLQMPQHLRRIDLAFDQRDRISEVSAGPTGSAVEQNWRRIEQAEVLVEARNRGFHDACRPSVTAM